MALDMNMLCVEDVRCFSFQLLRALAHLDGTRIVHRDLKPENILLDPGSRAVRVADFGSAKVLDGEPSSSYICSRWWRAPELIFGASRYGTSDWWSCGCITAEMMLGRPLFTGESSWGQMYEIVRALGTPTLEEVEAMQAGGDCRLAGHFAKLAELERPASAWEERSTLFFFFLFQVWSGALEYSCWPGMSFSIELLPAFAEERQALELPESLLSFDPAKRLHPAVAMRSSFFQHLPDDPNPLPPNLVDYSSLAALLLWMSASRADCFTPPEKSWMGLPGDCCVQLSSLSCLADGSAVTWGDAACGGDSGSVQEQLKKCIESKLQKKPLLPSLLTDLS
eukprot:s7884_g1.t1